MSWLDKKINDNKYTKKNIEDALNEMQRVGKLSEEERVQYDLDMEKMLKENRDKLFRQEFFSKWNYLFLIIGVTFSHTLIYLMTKVWDLSIIQVSDVNTLFVWIILFPTFSIIVFFMMRNAHPRLIWFVGGLLFGVFAELV